jgi:hypothetical protein
MGHVTTAVQDTGEIQLLDDPQKTNAFIEPTIYVLRGVPSAETYQEFTVDLENGYGDHHLKAVFHFKLKFVAESLHEFATVIKHLVH